MAHRAVKKKRGPLLPDRKYQDVEIASFILAMMKAGKKTLSTRIVYEALNLLEEKAGKPAKEMFHQALANVRPEVEVKSRRVGGSTYQVPVEIRDSRKRALSIRWLVTAARSRNGRSMAERLCAELMDACNSTGTAHKKKEEIHRTAEANKAFTHYRW